MNNITRVADYLKTVKPSKSYEDYERHKKALLEIADQDTDLWLEIVKELTDRMFL